MFERCLKGLKVGKVFERFESFGKVFARCLKGLKSLKGVRKVFARIKRTLKGLKGVWKVLERCGKSGQVAQVGLE